MNWDDFDAFCQVVDHGGFTAAARALERPKSSLSASVSRLEEQLGTRLLERTTRRLRLTDAGDSLYRDISKPFSQLRELAVDALAKGTQVQGTLRIAAPYEFGAHHLASVACRVMTRYPALKVQIDVEHARVALFERHYDIVFSALEHRVAPSTVVTKRVYSLERGLFASPELMVRCPAFAGPDDLNALPLLAGGEDHDWPFTGADGSTVVVDVRNPPLRSGNAEVRLQAAMAGLGVARITASFCAPAVAQGRLVRLLPQWQCAPLRIHALLPGRRLVPAKVRVFLDGLEDEAAQQGGATAAA
ncbi:MULTISPECIES: LysR family transcriptional regulator [Ramlibacter]|uniref:LysR family transcriptional regulator n=1 Tax=Ramlibacter pinisoli TaxID=2682844 RepID=A0A6N8IME4_9BURK|nr:MULTISPECIES: LysR family transcriptional regulator [Ramlibacter]MBA2960613.1 LysR family transcriptional regulator [Ramlibacter sp. CGMCC 1.13660]MVQ27944.1 LysR family transcriptional regulator [Ramlibacter pinisoli]